MRHVPLPVVGLLAAFAASACLCLFARAPAGGRWEHRRRTLGLEGAAVMRCLLTLAMFICFAANIQADFSFNVGNTAVTGNASVTSPYATVGITGDTNTGKVTFKVDVAPQDGAKLGAFGFNLGGGVKASDFTLTSFSGVGGSTSGWNLHTGGQMSGFGKFAMEVGPKANASGSRLTDYIFALQMAPGKYNEANPANFIVANSGAGNAPHAFAFALEYFPKSGNTGFVGVPVAHNMPEPSSLVLCLLSCVCSSGMYHIRRRKSHATAAAVASVSAPPDPLVPPSP